MDYIFTPVVPEILRAKVMVFAELYRKNQEIAKQATQLSTLNQVLEQKVRDIELLNVELRGSNTELMHSREQLRHLTAHVQALREEERARIAREIHDDLGGSLTGLKLDIRQIQRSLDPDRTAISSKFDNLYQAIDHVIKSVRRIATELRPAMLDDLGLAATIEWQLREFEQRSGIHGQLHLAVSERRFEPDTSTALFRIFQEALTNVARHAQATSVKVTLQEQADHLQLQLIDNGCGIEPARLRNSRSLGLVSMRERAQLLSGELTIQGAPGGGTVVFVDIPLQAQVAAS